MPFYAKRRKFTALNDTARVLRVIPVIELRVLQTIYSPNSCTTFRKSCTTVTPLLKKNLGFSQIEILRVDCSETKVVGHRDLPGVKKDCPCYDV